MCGRSALAWCIMLSALAWAVVPTGAEIIIVTSDSGGTGGPGCTLRDAITAANTDTPTAGCPAGNGVDTIELPVDVTITLTAVDNTTTGENGLPVVASAITINGNGATIERFLFVATPKFRIFYVSAELILNNVSVVNGEAAGFGLDGAGGGLYISIGATALLTNVNISGCSAYIAGGGISNIGSDKVTLTNCIVNGNSAGGLGGGILSDNTDLLLTNTTVCGNTPDQIYGDPWTDNGGNLIADECPPCVAADFDYDGTVGAADLAELLGSWGPCPDPCNPFATCPADLDGNCDVGPFDLALLLGSWGPCS